MKNPIARVLSWPTLHDFSTWIKNGVMPGKKLQAQIPGYERKLHRETQDLAGKSTQELAAYAADLKVRLEFMETQLKGFQTQLSQASGAHARLNALEAEAKKSKKALAAAQLRHEEIATAFNLLVSGRNPGRVSRLPKDLTGQIALYLEEES